MATAECPYCDSIISVNGKVGIGKEIRCPACGESLEVVETNPLILEMLYEFEDDDYFDYDLDD